MFSNMDRQPSSERSAGKAGRSGRLGKLIKPGRAGGLGRLEKPGRSVKSCRSGRLSKQGTKQAKKT